MQLDNSALRERVNGISVVIPCYRSETTLVALIERLKDVLPTISKVHEIILVCDRSPDGTWQLVQKLADQNPNIRGFELARRRGQQIAVMAGLGQVSHDFVVTMDDDLQQSPEDIPGMFATLFAKDADIVIASLKSKQHGRFRNFGTFLTRSLAQVILKLEKPIKFSSFRVFPRWLSDEAIQLNMPEPVVGYALLFISDRVENHELEHGKRQGETRSGYKITHLIKYFLSMLFLYSVLPIRMISVIGYIGAFVSLVIAALYLFLAVFDFIGGNGFATVTILVSLFSSLILASIGILGQYISILSKIASGDKNYHIRSKT